MASPASGSVPAKFYFRDCVYQENAWRQNYVFLTDSNIQISAGKGFEIVDYSKVERFNNKEFIALKSNVRDCEFPTELADRVATYIRVKKPGGDPKTEAEIRQAFDAFVLRV